MGDGDELSVVLVLIKLGVDHFADQVTHIMSKPCRQIVSQPQPQTTVWCPTLIHQTHHCCLTAVR